MLARTTGPSGRVTPKAPLLDCECRPSIYRMASRAALEDSTESLSRLTRRNSESGSVAPPELKHQRP